MQPSIRNSRARGLGLVIGITLVAAACGSDDVGFEGLPVGSATITQQVDFTEIAPFASFGSAQGNFAEGQHGTFGIFGAGAASPPHTHSSEYYAVVIEGEMNNPFGTEADPPSLVPGSFWTVPANDQHVTACLTPDNECRFFFHATSAFDFTPIDELTQPRSSEAGSVPLDTIDFEELAPYDGAATMWGDRGTGPHGTIVRVEAGESTGDLAQRNAFTLVPATGALSIDTGNGSTDVAIGSIVEAETNTPHSLACCGNTDCVFYLFSDGALDIDS